MCVYLYIPINSHSAHLPVYLSSGRCNKNPLIEWLIKNTDLLPTVVERGLPASGEIPLPGCTLLAL